MKSSDAAGVVLAWVLFICAMVVTVAFTIKLIVWIFS